MRVLEERAPEVGALVLGEPAREVAAPVSEDRARAVVARELAVPARAVAMQAWEDQAPGAALRVRAALREPVRRPPRQERQQ